MSTRLEPLFLAGPTASGKSDVALALAESLGGEILAVDSMQIYRGLDIGTAKATSTDRARVPHHLIDLVDPDASFDAARWLEAAIVAEAEVRARGKRPVFCGGTGLYFRAWFEGLDAIAPPDPARRAILEATPLAELLAELADRDPVAFAAVDRLNPRRVIRAVERLRDEGPGRCRRSPSLSTGLSHVRTGRVFGIRRDPVDLRRRIDARVDAMFAAGLVEETRGLLARGLERNRTATQAIGYRQVVEYLRGERDLAATVTLVKTRTWQFARRQMTWFRHQTQPRWVDVPVGESPTTTMARIVSELG